MSIPIIDFSHLPDLVNDNFYPLLWDDKRIEVLVGGASSGKCFAKGTKIKMYSGEVKNVEDIKEGEEVMGVDFTPRNVFGVTSGFGRMYKIVQYDGKDYTVNGYHILCLKHRDTEEYIEISVMDYLEKPESWKDLYVGYKVYPEEFKKEEICEINVFFAGHDFYYGFAVDKDHKFLLSDNTVTHNSYFVAQKIIYKTIIEKGHRWLAARKVKKDVRHSCYDLLKHTINVFGFQDLFDYNDTETIITCRLNGNDIIGVGLDDVDKLKSFFDPTDFWFEEADQTTERDFNQMNLRLRGNTPFVKQGILTMNPIWAGHWIKKRFFDKTNPNVTTNRSTYRTNKFLDAETRRELEEIVDPYFKMVYVDGEWGVYGNVVFSNYIIEDFDYKEDDLENVFTGMDFGYTHAATIVRGGFKDGEMYIFDELYGKGWTNDKFIENALEYFGDDLFYFDITADSAEPDRIEEWNRKGFRVKEAKKGPGSLKFGMDYLVRQRIHIHATKCENTAREMQTFKRREDKEGNALEDFVEIGNDCLSAIRYGTEKLWDDGATLGRIADYGMDVAGYLGF